VKEPNGVLVMTTCKCRENTKNLVMTRTYFTEMLENKIAQGKEQGRKRAIEILENYFELSNSFEEDEEIDPNPEWDSGFQAAMALLRNEYNV
jgi:hypothetical protein